MSFIQKDKPLHNYSTFGIGGPAKFFASVSSQDQLQEALFFAKKENLPFFILGKGSNILFDDKGYNGLVIHNQIQWSTIENTQVTASSGYSFSLLGVQTARKGLTGLEFAAGIPGSVGGAVFMNAGANQKETKDMLAWVDYLSIDGTFSRWHRQDLFFTYRTSSFQKMKGVIISASFTLQKDPMSRKSQIEMIQKRKATQPLKEKSAGCVFRNPQNSSAGMLIEKSGLKGDMIGGAQISSHHANFVINKGNATAKDVLDLVRYAQEAVKKKMGIALEKEIRYLPYQGIK